MTKVSSEMKTSVSKLNVSPIIQIIILYLIAVIVQRIGSELTSLYTINTVTQNFFENFVGLVFVLYVVVKLNLWNRIYWFSHLSFKRWYLFLLPCAYILINIGELYPHSNQDLVVGLLSNMFTGSLEEILCRGIVIVILFDYLIKREHKNIPLKAALLSSLLFGLVHFVNVFEKPETIGVITGQVIYATFIGMGFAACYLRTRSLVPLMIIHAAINIMGFLTSAPNEPAAASFIDTLPAIIICFPLMIYGIVILSGDKSNSIEFSR